MLARKPQTHTHTHWRYPRVNPFKHQPDWSHDRKKRCDWLVWTFLSDVSCTHTLLSLKLINVRESVSGWNFTIMSVKMVFLSFCCQIVDIWVNSTIKCPWCPWCPHQNHLDIMDFEGPLLLKVFVISLTGICMNMKNTLTLHCGSAR